MSDSLHSFDLKAEYQPLQFKSVAALMFTTCHAVNLNHIPPHTVSQKQLTWQGREFI